MSISSGLSGSNIINHQSTGATLFKLAKTSKAIRRNPLPGFPADIKFKTLDEINEYFDGDLVQCLLCGRWMKSIGRHVTVHGYTPYDYKERYGLPFSRGLSSSSYHSYRSELHKTLYEGGGIPLSTESVRLVGSEAAKGRDRPPCQPFTEEIRREQCLGKSKFSKIDIERVDMVVLEEGRTIADVCSMPEHPSIHSYYKIKRLRATP